MYRIANIENGAFDAPDERDWKYDEVFGDTSGDLPESVVFLPDMIEDQSTEYVMRMSCTRQSPVHIINAQNKYLEKETDAYFVHVDVKPIWLNAIKENPGIEQDGDSISNGLKQCLSSKFITAYSRVDTIDNMKKSLAKGRLIATGSNDGNWKSVENTHIYAQRTDGKTVGHAFCIVGYNPTGWTAINSYGEDNGYFTIPYELTDTLYTRYSVSDAKDEKYIITYRKSIMDNITIEAAKTAMIDGIWNGTEPQKPATREEVAAMIQRAMEKLSPK